MHPAPSIILFTVLSGLGFGLMIFLGLGMPAPTGINAFIWFALAYIFAVGGLISSTFHLGNPQRALKAFTQWKTSWLSREAWLSAITLTIMAIYGAGLVFLETRWTALGYLGAACALATVYGTSMIYAQLKTVPRWNHPTTPAMFIAYALAGGSLLAGQVSVSLVLMGCAAALQAFIFFTADTRFAARGHTLETATQLGDIGKVRAFEPPHTGTNYLLHEMVHMIGRKHAQKLQIIALLLLVAPIILLLLPFSHTLAAGAVLAHLAGVLTARWLFFAQAEHVVGLYYGKRG
ncbi:DmsC/YnfH family molybdoenzyme membrane anchor subunit [Nereida sp. MMG025]|uniref:dimethyl sulfoxide reductase anchor subunit family protein n=1 Tax=Nereida sp. MMG025 TaxID=2909981 RepID=UPI001F014F11|nr:DmsC/YnfH family molybdoenzyme membrane anchor subunit [Nereida sp. MMG025]MCF6445791.1 dimethyl sulfoxide reductase anchor subunit [Nereida sp. MMG025]